MPSRSGTYRPTTDPPHRHEPGGTDWTVVYDGECGLCRRSVDLLRSWDTRDRLRCLAFQAPGVMERYPEIPERAFREAVKVIAPDGRHWSGADAVEQALARTPRGRRLVWLFRLPFARPIARRVYRWVAHHRPFLARFF